MRRLPVLLLLVASLASCAVPKDDQVLDVVFDPCAPVVIVPAADATAGEIAAIDDAIALWNVVVDTRLGRTAIAGAPELAINFENGSLIFRGVYEDEIGEIIVNRGLAGHDRVVTIAHELGHALGLWHVPMATRASVMNPGNVVIEPDLTDAGQLLQLWGACDAVRVTPARP